NPLLSWTLSSDGHGARQTAYQVLVASGPELLKSGRADIWDSGIVPSDHSQAIGYSGIPLVSKTDYFWRVRVWDQRAKPSRWSQTAHWTTGFLHDEAWQGEWIAMPSYSNGDAPLLRKTVTLEKRPRKALIFVSGLGYYELYVNGKKVGDRVLDPGFTDYTKRVFYVAWDVTDLLQKGSNAIGVMLGGGWFHVATPELFGFEKAPWTAPPKLRLEMDMAFPDGTNRVLGSDTTWKCSTGALEFNCIRAGETWDARLDKPDWNLPEFGDTDWEHAEITEPPQGKMIAQTHPPIRAVETIQPVSVSEPKPGIYVFDLGVNIAGWVSFKTSGTEGQKITLQFNEKLSPDGTVDMRHTSGHTYGRFQTGEFILKGEGVETWEPRFTYHGFQYIQVSGLLEKPSLDALTGKCVHTDPEPAGAFACSDPRINKIQEVLRRTQLNNLHGIPTDCPQREKMGWLHDGCVTVEEAIFNWNMANFYTKWYRDLIDAQEANGHIPSIVPTCGWGQSGANGEPHAFSDPWWGGAIVLVPWRLYLYYGDRNILAEAYPAMKNYLRFLESAAQDDIIHWHLGDWLEQGAGGGSRRTPVALSSTSAWFLMAKIAGDVARILDRAEEAEQYDTTADRIKEAFNARFLSRETGHYAEESQMAQSVPLLYDMVPEELKEAVTERLIENIVEVRKGHVSTGIVGTWPLFECLTKIGRSDLAFEMLVKEDYPGWLWMINNGATTLWEAWDDVSSRNHPAFGCVGAWFYQVLAGIRPDPDRPGFRHIVIQPEPVGDLSWVKARYESAQGLIVSEWEKSDGRFTLSLSLPANTSAIVSLPASSNSTVLESGKPASNASGVLDDLGFENGRRAFRVASGDYCFQVSQ
ncbi:MAG TPA: glycoside hydrolase family 78 protein, partial [bacterium]|nr:glycoside hydrolase family 78 protein [bacterium]